MSQNNLFLFFLEYLRRSIFEVRKAERTITLDVGLLIFELQVLVVQGVYQKTT
jgi:hypothetical protein